MMTKVIAWPPVGVTGAEWTESAPVNVSRSLITGRRYVSAHARKRRLATLNVLSLSAHGSGAGYMEILKRLIEGGKNLVRLTSYDINRAPPRADLRSEEVSWTDRATTLTWGEADMPLRWYSGAILSGTAGAVHPSGLWHSLTVTGLPPGEKIARPGEFVNFAGDGQVTVTQVVAEALSNADGVATLRVTDALRGTGRVSIGVADTAVFEVVDIPRAIRPVRGHWSYAWSFREVFADETPGGFTEIDPWT